VVDPTVEIAGCPVIPLESFHSGEIRCYSMGEDFRESPIGSSKSCVDEVIRL
jgi:hypothetical protein